MTRTAIFSLLAHAPLLLACADRPLMGETSGASGDTTMAADGGDSDGVPTTGSPSTDTTSTGATSTGATTTGSTTTADELTTGSDTCGFICHESEGDGPVECDQWAQDCPEGQKCLAWANDGGDSWNATKCSPVMGDGQPGEPCTAPEGPLAGVDDCAKGAMCWDVDGENHGTCVEQCGGSPESPTCTDNENFDCPVVADGVLNLCFPLCDLLLQDCPGDDLCLPLNDTALCVLSGDGGVAFDPCEFINACDKGLICVGSAAAAVCEPMFTGCCTPMCALDDPDFICPGVGQSCVPLFGEGMGPPKFANVGYCTVPA